MIHCGNRGFLVITWHMFENWKTNGGIIGSKAKSCCNGVQHHFLRLISCLSWIISLLIRDSSAVWRLLWICCSRGTSESYTYGKQRICFSNSGSAHFHVSWLSDSIFYQKPLYKSLHVPIIFLFIHNHLTLRKWCCTPLQHDFALDPIIPPFDFHFRIYKRDLAWKCADQELERQISCFPYI
jgi:hypothetical protein